MTKERDNYRCRQCRDQGWRHIWHPASVAIVRESQDEINTIGTRGTMNQALAACTCNAGNRLVQQYSDRPQQSPIVFDASEHCDLKLFERTPLPKLTTGMSDADKVPYLDHLQVIQEAYNTSHEWQPDPDGYAKITGGE